MQKEAKKYERSTAGLRDLLFDTILSVRDKGVSTSEAAQVANLANQIIASLDIELKAQMQTKKIGGDADALTLAPPVLMLTRDKGES